MSQTLLPRRLFLSPRRRRGHHPLLSGARPRWLSSAPPGRRTAAGGGWEEESKAVKVAVWWDFENCHVPSGVNVCRVAARVTAALRASGIRGPVAISAFGDVAQLPRTVQEALIATGVVLTHVPNSGKNSSDRSFMADLIYWIAQNPPPVHFFLISGDGDFANILHRLRMSNYNVLLACPDRASANVTLCSAATIMWPWTPLVKGEALSPKHYNHPPDGVHGSWYGHYKGTLDDPFLDMEQEEYTRSRSIPKPVVNGICQTLHSYPDGVSLSILRAELKKNNVIMDKDFYGYKRFSALLQSMPAIVKFIPSLPGECEPAVVGTKTLNSAQNIVGDMSVAPTQDEKQPPSAVSSSPAVTKTLSSAQDGAGYVSITPTQGDKKFPSAVPSSASNLLTKGQNPSSPADRDQLTKDQKLSPPVDPIVVPEQPVSHKETDVNTVTKKGLLERIRILWNGPVSIKPEVPPSHEGARTEIINGTSTPQQGQNVDNDKRLSKMTVNVISGKECSDGNDKTSAVNAKFSTQSAGNSSDNLKLEQKLAKSKRETTLTESSEAHARDASLSMGKAEQEDGSPRRNMGLFSWIASWWKFGKSDADNATNGHIINGTRADSDKELESVKTSAIASEQQVGHDMFTKSYFWDALERYLSTPKGSAVVSKSKTRDELVCGLQKQGHWPVKSLDERDLHHLISLLVSEKKWIEETASRNFPFRLTLPQKRTCVPSHSSMSGGLSSLFANGKRLEQAKDADDRARRIELLTREEILSNCQTMLKELLLQYKHGFNVSIFKRLFAQKFGYELDHQKLGYPDIVSLLRIMPGARIKASRILPAENVKESPIGKGSEKETNCDDFVWEELGPVSDTVKTTGETDTELSYDPPSISDDEFSDDEDRVGQQPKEDGEHSSLLEMIDSWSNSKDCGAGKNPEGIDGLVNCSRSSLDDNPDNPIMGGAQKLPRPPHKKYSFVSDSDDEKEKGKLVQSVLGSLQKAGNSRLNS